eukprot:3662393-Alexandrium_andersonii.AAC.1
MAPQGDHESEFLHSASAKVLRLGCDEAWLLVAHSFASAVVAAAHAFLVGAGAPLETWAA